MVFWTSTRQARYDHRFQTDVLRETIYFLDNKFREANPGFLLIAGKWRSAGLPFWHSSKDICSAHVVRILTPRHLHKSHHGGSANAFLGSVTWLDMVACSGVATGGGATCPPPNLRSDTPWDRCRSKETFMSEKMGICFRDLFPRFTCIDATANVLWSCDYEKRESWRSCWRSYFGKPSVKLRNP